MRLSVTAFFLCLNLFAAAQNRANIWYFQDYGLDFNQDPPLLLTEVAFHQNRAMGIACDVNGNLLFYTDNFTVFDRAHNKMPNGSGLLDPDLSRSTLQNSVVVPKPGSETIFYVFMVDPRNGAIDQSGLYYFVVDMELNDGMGDVSVRPQKLVSATSNKLASVLHTNRTDVWVTTQIANTNTYKSFLVTSSGIGDPVTASLGTTVSSFTAQLKFSPDGTKVASADEENINLFDFDATTGVLSNARLLVLPQFLWPDAVSFSPDGTKLYAAMQSVVQYDVSSGDISKIKASEQVLKGYVNNNFYDFQLAPDGKIYITKGGGGGTSDYLGAITNPNESGATANVVERYFYLDGFDSFVNWTPVFIESYFMRPEIVVENTCFNDQTRLSLSNTRYVQRVKWTIGEGEAETTMDVEHVFSAAKTWDIEAEVDYGIQKVIVKKAVVINPIPEFDLGSDRTVCEGTLLTADVSGEASYLWNSGDTTRKLMPLSTGAYSVETTYESTGCRYDDNVNLVVNETPFVDLGPDSVVCNKPAYVLRSRTELSDVKYTWNDPAITGPELTVNNGGLYYLEAKSNINGCVHRDSVFIALKFAPEPDLGPDTVVCNQPPFVLKSQTKLTNVDYKWSDPSVTGPELTVKSSGIYFLDARSIANGCVDRDSVFVTLKSAPEPDLGPDRTINLDESFLLDMTEYGPGSFLWEDMSTSSVRNVEGSKLFLGLNALSLAITGTNGCIGSDELNVMVTNILGVDEEKGYNVYPVPAHNTLFIEASGLVEVSLISMTGTLMTEQTMAGNGLIDLRSYPNGMYILQVKSALRTIRQVVSKN
jgi:hypothetical protein